jgi:hypothetical protein
VDLVTSELEQQESTAVMEAREWIRSAGQAEIEGNLVPVQEKAESLR